MNNLNTLNNDLTRLQHTTDKQINKLIAEATILLFEIKALTEKGVKLNK